MPELTSLLTALRSTSPVWNVRMRNGNLYIDKSLYEAFFNGLDSVVLLKQKNDLLIMPILHTASGGLLLKICNSNLDRVVHAQEFFRNNGIDETIEKNFSANWKEDLAALRLDLENFSPDSQEE